MADAPKGTFVLPTPVAVQRYQQMKVESILNTPYQVTNEQPPLEFCLREGKEPEEITTMLGLDDTQAEIAVDILEEAADGGLIEEAYGLRGGVLNILLPPANDEVDYAYHQLDTSDDTALAKFGNKPNEIFAALTPGQVWAGTGKHEMSLADEYLPRLWREMKDKDFPTTGAVNTEWLSRLRLWSYNPAKSYNGRVVDVVHYERNEAYKNRLALARDLGIKLQFEEPDL